MTKPFVAILMGSDSDMPVMQNALDILDKLAVPYEVKITSAHRTPQTTHEFVKDADARGCGVFIAAAGMAAHLAGTVAGLTTKPVVGIPIDAGPLNGVDSLLSTVMMPSGMPVATVAIGKTGASNAAYLAAQILAVNDAELAERVMQERERRAQAVLDKDAQLQAKLSQQ